MAECVPRPTIHGETVAGAPGVTQQVLAACDRRPGLDLQAIHTRLA